MLNNNIIVDSVNNCPFRIYNAYEKLYNCSLENSPVKICKFSKNFKVPINCPLTQDNISVELCSSVYNKILVETSLNKIHDLNKYIQKNIDIISYLNNKLSNLVGEENTYGISKYITILEEYNYNYKSEIKNLYKNINAISTQHHPIYT
jgi:hypothetical protein